MEYTKGKWEVTGKERDFISTTDGKVIARTLQNYEANAKRIVTAVNSHDAMYEALKLLANSYSIDCNTEPDNLEYYGEDWQALIKALALAEGRE